MDLILVDLPGGRNDPDRNNPRRVKKRRNICDPAGILSTVTGPVVNGTSCSRNGPTISHIAAFMVFEHAQLRHNDRHRC